MDPADRIFELLPVSGLDQKGLAEKLGISPDVVSLWNRKKSTSYRRYIEQLSNILGTSVDYLLNGEKNLPSISEDRGQVQKLVDELNKIGINVDTLSESQITKIAKLAKTLFEE